MNKKWIFLFLILIVLSGCSNISGKNEFFNKISSIEKALNNQDWEQLKSFGHELVQFHEKTEWKLQLMGDEDEYESLHESINRLIIAIEENDKTEAKLELVTIKTLVEDIYSS